MHGQDGRDGQDNADEIIRFIHENIGEIMHTQDAGYAEERADDTRRTRGMSADDAEEWNAYADGLQERMRMIADNPTFFPRFVRAEDGTYACEYDHSTFCMRDAFLTSVETIDDMRDEMIDILRTLQRAGILTTQFNAYTSRRDATYSLRRTRVMSRRARKIAERERADILYPRRVRERERRERERERERRNARRNAGK